MTTSDTLAYEDTPHFAAHFSRLEDINSPVDYRVSIISSANFTKTGDHKTLKLKILQLKISLQFHKHRHV